MKSVLVAFIALIELTQGYSSRLCSGAEKADKFSIYGNALTDSDDCLSREGERYPALALKKMLPQLKRMYRGSTRQGKTLFEQNTNNNIQSPYLTSQELLNFHKLAQEGRIEAISEKIRKKRQAEETTNNESDENSTAENEDVSRPGPQTCVPDDEITPATLCKSTYNTTAPMYGVSLTSGEPVTIVQIFPDLLQQVVFEKCDATECDVLHGECVQTYVPYLFLVIPLGPVTLTGQDYVLVESGCTCRPKYSRPGSEPNPASIIPSF